MAAIAPERGLTPADTLYLDPIGLSAWLGAAIPGDKKVYAMGPALDPAHPTVRRVAGLISDGLVLAYKYRANGVLVHGMQRRLPEPRLLAASVPADAEPLYRLLQDRAERAEACPSYGAIAELLGLSDRQAGRYLFQKLLKTGAVRVVVARPRGVPVIEIAATGARTAG